MSSNDKAYGPANPHPFWKLRPELIWEGKDDEYGSLREVDGAGSIMPLQKIETIDQQNLVGWIKGLKALMEAGK